MIAAPESHEARQIRMLERLADWEHQNGNVDKAAGLLFEARLLEPATIVRASSVTAARY